jgi:hypothetical protein
MGITFLKKETACKQNTVIENEVGVHGISGTIRRRATIVGSFCSCFTQVLLLVAVPNKHESSWNSGRIVGSLVREFVFLGGQYGKDLGRSLGRGRLEDRIQEI